MLIPAVFLTSLSSLAFEVLLTRVFSISQWHHLSFMVISLALFGFAASGTGLSLLDQKRTGWEKQFSTPRAVRGLIIAQVLTELGAFAGLGRLPLDYFKLPSEPVQALYLLVAYLLLAIPFFFAGLIISLAYADRPAKTGLIYLATMAGSAIGALVPVLLLPSLDVGRSIVATAVIPLVGLFRESAGNRPAGLTSRAGSAAFRLALGTGLAAALFGSTLFFSDIAPLFRVRPSPYKALSQALMFPDTTMTGSSAGIRGRVCRISSPHLRFAPGLSLKHTDPIPAQWAAFEDGENQTVFYDSSDRERLGFSRHSLLWAGYRLCPAPDSVLLIQHGGGAALPAALISAAREIRVLAWPPEIGRFVEAHYGLRVITETPRAYLARHPARFDLIQVEHWGASLPGTASLSQHHLFTLEAVSEYLRHLSARGVLIISRKLRLPPSDAIRMWATAYESLRSHGLPLPERHLIMLRNWDTYTLIVSRSPLPSGNDVDAFAETLNFDLVFRSGLDPAAVNRFNVFDRPFYFNAIHTLAAAYRSGTQKEYFKTALMDIAPQSDNRPFPEKFIKWSGIHAVFTAMGKRLYPLMLSGETVILVVLAEALVVALVLLGLPLVSAAAGSTRFATGQTLYFLAVGAGFMFVELFFIHQFVLLFGDPVISFTVVLAGILVSSGLGGIISQHIRPARLPVVLIVLGSVLLCACSGIAGLVREMLELPTFCRYGIALLTLFPLGILLGIPFPAGMRHLPTSPVQRAYAWSANGCTAVLTAVFSTQLAITIGIQTILFCGARRLPGCRDGPRPDVESDPQAGKTPIIF